MAEIIEQIKIPFDHITQENLVKFIKNTDFSNILNKICCVSLDNIYIDYRYFKFVGNNETYEIITNYVIMQINIILNVYETFTTHTNMKSLSLSDAEKHRKFIINISQTFKGLYPDKLNKCFIYNAPFVFARVYDIIKVFIDKPTQKKVIMI